MCDRTQVKYVYGLAKDFASEYTALFSSRWDVPAPIKASENVEQVEQAEAVPVSPPQAKMEQPKAKLEALEVNRRQWGIGREESGVDMAADASGSTRTAVGSETDLAAQPSKRIGSFSPIGSVRQPVQTRGRAGRRIGSIKPIAWRDVQGASGRDRREGEPGSTKMKLPKAKLEAVEVNRRQWGIGEVEGPSSPVAKMEFPRAKLEALEVNRRQWGIKESATAALSWRIGSANPAGTRPPQPQTRSTRGQRIGSIKPYANDPRGRSTGPSAPGREEPVSKPAGGNMDQATMRRRIGSMVPAGMSARLVTGSRNTGARRIGSIKPVNETPSSLGRESSDLVEIYNAGKPLRKGAGISEAKRACLRENLRRCAREPFLNPGLGAEWESWAPEEGA
jgi:hypothetical protein